MLGYKATVQVGVVKAMGRTPSEGLGVPEGHDSVPTCEEGLRERGLVYCHIEGKHGAQPGSIAAMASAYRSGYLLVSARVVHYYKALTDEVDIDIKT